MYIIYGKDGCIWCDQAKKFLVDNKEEFEFRNIEVNVSARSEFVIQFPNVRTVPQIITPDGDKIGGFDALVNLYK